jgi:transcriptional regulator with XRE-family HTH domain
MSTDPSWTRLPAARQAADTGQHAVLLRLARTAAGLTLEAAGRRVGYSAATLSRMESGKRPLTDMTVLRRLCAEFDIPLRMFGLAEIGVVPARGVSAADKVPTGQLGDRLEEGGDGPVRRRDLLGGLAGLVAMPLVPAGTPRTHAAGDAATDLVSGLERVFLRGTSAEAAINPAELRAGLACVRADFQASRYRALAARLPVLLASIDSTTTEAAVAAELYNTAVHVCIKLKATGLDWLAADRALAAARQAEDPAVSANVTRNVATLLRGVGRYDTAQQLALEAADRLPLSGPAVTAEHLSLYGMLLCNAGYAAAQAGDRSRCAELLSEADGAAARLGGDRNEHWTAFGPTEVLMHRVSAAWRLGDSGTAIGYARKIRAGTIRLPERQARYWVDVARAFDQWGKPAECYRALRIAEIAAPEEIHAQPKVRALTRNLLTAPTSPALGGLRHFATRLGAA